MITNKHTIQKLGQIEARYAPLCFETIADVPMAFFETREHYRSEPGRAAKAAWKPAQRGLRWGGDGWTAWFRGGVKLPASCAGRKVMVQADTGGKESLLFVNGEPRGVFDSRHQTVMMAKRGAAGHKYRIALEAYSGHAMPSSKPDDPMPVIARGSRAFQGVALALEREDVIAFLFDLRTLLQLANCLDEHSLRRGKILAGLAAVFAAIDAIPQETGEASWRRKLAAARKIMKPLLEARNGSTAPFMGLTGHSHIDTAWKWTLAETERKCARTFSSVLNLMEQYPEFRFMQSAPCHADMVRREYPSVFKGIQKMVKAGRWEPNGAMWVEPDCNIPSGESFVRQLLFGQSATREWFGYTSDTLWMPDVFGYSAALPQILRGAGVEFFCTTKISWNDTTRFPYDTFVWRGIDGSPVIAHFHAIRCLPEPQTLIKQWNLVPHPDAQDRRLCPVGYGDGGGGPQFEMLESARRVRDLEGCPRAEFISVSDFMKGIRDGAARLPEWSGELYLEVHRGVQTSVAGIKRGNRKAELALRDAEYLLTRATLAGAAYPAAELNCLWKTLLVNQFHDILPGSSIAAVNDQAIRELNGCANAARELARGALGKLAGGGQSARGRGGANAARVMVANTLSWDREDEIVLDGAPAGFTPADGDVAGQWITDVEGARKLAVAGLTVPAFGSAILELRKGKAAATTSSPFTLREQSVEMPFARVRFDRAGRMISFIDKASRREIVRHGGALNSLLIGEDVPINWDNWDIDYDQQYKMATEDRLVKREVAADGPLQARVRSTYRLGAASTVKQDIVFHATTPRVDFETVVDWHETHKHLKAGFDLDILAETARHEIQFGHVERSTHENQLTDLAQFEVCAHKWSDLSENGFGVALLNDGKYGVQAKNGQLRLSLLKSGTHPDYRGDAGWHRFTYALLPHGSGFSVEAVVRPAYQLNAPLLAIPVTGAARAFGSLMTCDAANVIIETVKWAESGKGFIARLYEAGKTGTHAKVSFGVKVKSVSETNLLEEEPRRLLLANNALKLYFRPFEIKTLYCVI